MAKQSSKLDSIKTIIHEDYLIQNGFLEEVNIMKRKIVAGGLSYLVYRFEQTKKQRLTPFFAEKPGLNVFCDYVLFVEEDAHLYILLVELKEGTESARLQLLAGERLVNFILKSIDEKDFELNIHFKKIRISEARGKRSRNRGKSNKPSSPLEFDENNILNYDRLDAFRIKEILGI